MKRRTLRMWLVLLVVVGGLGAAIYENGDPMIAMAADYRTSRAELRTVTLKDGTIVHLGATSSISTSYTREERRVKILAGEAWFVVAPTVANREPRPFVLRTAHGTVVTNDGAEFVVVRYTEAATVFNLKGKVTVEMNHPREHWLPRVTLNPGQLVRYDSDNGLGPVKTASDIGIATAWSRGRLVLFQLDLSEAVARINRYAHGWVYVAKSELETKQVTGDFDVAHLDDAIQGMATQVHAKVLKPLPFITIIY